MKAWSIVLALILSVPVICVAETMYVIDQIEVAVRSGKGVEYRILALVKSNDPLEVLERDGDYARVRLPGGAEGWVLRRYLSAGLPKPEVIKNLQTQMAALQTRQTQSAQALADLGQENARLQGDYNRAQKDVGRLKKNYAELSESCADFSQLKNEYAEVKKQLMGSRQEASALALQNAKLKKRENMLWFVSGAAAVLAGFIIGVVLQGLRSRRRRSLRF